VTGTRPLSRRASGLKAVVSRVMKTISRWYVWLGAFYLTALAAGKATSGQSQPFRDSVYQGGPQSIPGRVQCAYYDLGGEGIAYHDADAKNQGSGGLNPADGSYLNQFRRNEGVDTSYTRFQRQIDNSPYDLVSPPEGQLYVGRTEAGEWFNMTVSVEHAGIYTVDLLYTSYLESRRNHRLRSEREKTHASDCPPFHL
jgi:hypothetical protein